MNRFKKYLKRICAALAALILLLCIVALLIIYTPLHGYLAEKSAGFLSKQLKTHVEIGDFTYIPFKTFRFKGLLMHDQKGDTLAFVEKFDFEITKLDWKHKVLRIKDVELNGAWIDLHKTSGEDSFNFAFLLPSPADSSYVPNNDPQWQFIASQIRVRNSHFIYADLNKSTTESYLFNANNVVIDVEDLQVSNIEKKDSVFTGYLETIMLKERSGLQINALSSKFEFGNTRILLPDFKLTTPQSKISGEIELAFNGINAFNDFVDDVNFNASFDTAKVHSIDIAHFAKELKDYNTFALLRGNIKGTVNHFRGKNLYLALENILQFEGDANVRDITSQSLALLDIKAKPLVIDTRNLHKNYPELAIPEQMLKLGIVKFNGFFTGFYRDFVTEGSFNTALGDVTTDLNLKLLSNDLAIYSGNISSNNFDLGKFIDQKELGLVSLNGTVKGQGIEINNINTQLAGEIKSLYYKGYQYHNLKFDGEMHNSLFAGKVRSADENLFFDFDGTVDFTKQEPRFDFVSNIKQIKLDALGFTNDNSELSGEMEIHFVGDNIDNIEGIFDVKNFNWSKDGSTMHFDYLKILSERNDSQQSNIRFESDLADAYLKGNAKLSKLSSVFKNMMSQYLPSYFAADTNLNLYQNFDFGFVLKESKPILNFFEEYQLSSGRIEGVGHYTSLGNDLSMQIQTPTLSYSDFHLNNLLLNATTVNNKLVVNFNTQNLKQLDSILIDNLRLKAVLNNDSMQIALRVNQDTTYNYGIVNGLMVFDKGEQTITFEDSKLFSGANVWSIAEKGRLHFTDSITTVDHVLIINDTHFMAIDGKISSKPTDTLNVILNDLRLDVLNPLLYKLNTKLGGTAYAEISASGVTGVPKIMAHLETCSFELDDEYIGDLELNSIWNNKRNALEVDARILKVEQPQQYVDNETELERAKLGLTTDFNTPLLIDGDVFFKDGKEDLSLNISLNNASIKFLNKILNPELNEISGVASAKLKMTGSFNLLTLVGYADIDTARIRVDYLNTYYSLSKKNKNIITFTDNEIKFNNLAIYDNIMGNGSVNGEIYHDYFMHTTFNLRVDLQNMFVLNLAKKDNDLFYGQATATGYTTIIGVMDDLDFYVFAKSEKGSKEKPTVIKLPLDYGETSAAYGGFVTFVSPNDTIVEETQIELVENKGIGFLIDLEITPDAEIQVIFDEIAGDIIKAQGNGKLKLVVNKQNDFNMFGDYNIVKGDYLFTYENVLNKRFAVLPGSKLLWTGDPYDAQIDITAVYKLRASTKDLLAGQQTLIGIDSTRANLRVPVECYLNMKNSLLKPDLSFEIKIPTINANDFSDPVAVQLREINRDEQKLNEQIFGLLVLNRFLSSNSNLSLGGGVAAASVSELISNQINNLLSQYTSGKNVNIGINYSDNNLFSSSTSDLSGGELQVALNTTLFNDRVVVDGNLDVGSQYMRQRTNSAVGGDFSVEYKITEDGRLRAKAYNRIDDRLTLVNSQSNYRQGVGITYRRDFDKFDELYKKQLDSFKIKVSTKYPKLFNSWIPQVVPELEATTPAQINAVD